MIVYRCLGFKQSFKIKENCTEIDKKIVVGS